MAEEGADPAEEVEVVDEEAAVEEVPEEGMLAHVLLVEEGHEGADMAMGAGDTASSTRNNQRTKRQKGNYQHSKSNRRRRTMMPRSASFAPTP